MGVQISGDNIIVPGQITVAVAPTAATHVLRVADVSGYRAIVQDLVLSAGAPSDMTALVIPSSKWIPKRCFVCNPSADVSAATIELRSAVGGAGDDIVASILLANMTNADANTRAQVLTINASFVDTIYTVTMLYPRLTVAAAGGTCDLVFEYDDIVGV